MKNNVWLVFPRSSMVVVVVVSERRCLRRSVASVAGGFLWSCDTGTVRFGRQCLTGDFLHTGSVKKSTRSGGAAVNWDNTTVVVISKSL